MKIEIKSAETVTKSGTSKRTGKPYSIVEQVGYLFVQGEAYPQRCVLQIDDGVQPYQPGIYDTADELRVGDFGRLSVSRGLRLLPVSSRKVA